VMRSISVSTLSELRAARYCSYAALPMPRPTACNIAAKRRL
jgi:hypothetical protein